MTCTLLRTIAGIGVAVGLDACGWNSDPAAPDASAQPPVASQPDDGTVPASAFATVGALVGFLKALVASESQEPLRLDTSVAPPLDDSGEPLPLS